MRLIPTLKYLGFNALLLAALFTMPFPAQASDQVSGQVYEQVSGGGVIIAFDIVDAGAGDDLNGDEIDEVVAAESDDAEEGTAASNIPKSEYKYIPVRRH